MILGFQAGCHFGLNFLKNSNNAKPSGVNLCSFYRYIMATQRVGMRVGQIQQLQFVLSWVSQVSFSSV